MTLRTRGRATRVIGLTTIARMRPKLRPKTFSVGRWRTVTLVSPIRCGGRLPLRLVFLLGRHTDLLIRRLVQMRVIALARWTFLPTREEPRWLLFETSWSGSNQSYIPDLALLMRIQAQSIWGNVRRWPGPVPTTRVLTWVDSNDWGSDYFFTGYDDGASTQVILHALELQGSFESFVESSRGLSPDLLSQRWSEFATRSQDLLREGVEEA